MKIPPEAKRVFKGTIFDVYQWEQKLYDGSSTIFEALKRPATIQIIPVFNNRILLSYEEQPGKSRMFTFFGGRQEEGEEPLFTAKRELQEEAGLNSRDWELIKTYESHGKIEWQTYLYIARNCQKVSEQKLDAGEKIDIKEFTFEEFIDKLEGENFWSSIIASDISIMRYKDTNKLKEFKNKLLIQ